MKHDTMLSVALRRNHGKHIISEWSRRLSKALNYEIGPEHFVPLDRTQNLKAGVFERLRTKEGTVCVTSSKISLDEIAAILNGVSLILQSTLVLLFSSVDQFIGAVQLPANVLLPHFKQVWQVVDEDFIVVTNDAMSGLCIERNFYDKNSSYVREGVYEVFIWGEIAQSLMPSV